MDGCYKHCVLPVELLIQLFLHDFIGSSAAENKLTFGHDVTSAEELKHIVS
jgi:hypothetical protein